MINPSARLRRLAPAGVSLAVVTALVVPGQTAAASPSDLGSARTTAPQADTAVTAVDRTSAVEARRVDRVTVKLTWAKCVDTPTLKYPARARCAAARLPLDYDRPAGATVRVPVVKLPARVKGKRVGVLFSNPGGPGGSGVDLVATADQVLPATLTDRFDLIGFDPRGLGLSTQVRCFKTSAEQGRVLAMEPPGFPTNASELAAQRSHSRLLARGCSTTGKPLSAAMSTAEVARDLEVLRRTIDGKRKLTYLGFSYGTYLGQVYANLFPDRVRALVIDGVLDPVAWAGTPTTARQVVDDRIKTAEGAAAGFDELLRRCREAGPVRCPLAGRGDPRAAFELLVERLKKTPVVVEDPDFGPTTYTYPVLIGNIVGSLYMTRGTEAVTTLISGLLSLSDPAASATTRRAAASSVGRLTASLHSELGSGASRDVRAAAGRADDYLNFADVYAGVLCTDGRHPRRFDRWRVSADAADARVKHFGRFWNWSSSECAREYWTAADEDAYRGPWTRRTSGPVLVVGNYYDPATPYLGAKAAARLLPNSRLITGDSFGHTAYLSSSCMTTAVNRFLTQVTLPPKGTVCKGEYQPYTGTTAPGAASAPLSLLGPLGGGRPLPGR